MATNRKDSPRSKPSTEVKLRLWVFKLVFSDGTVCVEGYKPQDPMESELKCWHSTAIVDAINSRRLRTKSGTVYYLQGPMDIESALGYGYPEHLIDYFKDGFPPNWKELLSDFHKTLRCSNQCDVSQWFSSCVIDPGRKSLSSTRLDMGRNSSAVSTTLLSEAVDKFSRERNLVPVGVGGNKRKSYLPSAPMTPVAEDRDGEQSATPFSVKKSQRKLPSSPYERQVVAENNEDLEKENIEENNGNVGIANVDENVFVKPTMPAPKPKSRQHKGSAMSECSDTSSVHDLLEKVEGGDSFGVSQRGRILKPPLAAWAGQRILYDVSGNPVRLTDGVTQSATSMMASPNRVSLSALSCVYELSPARQAVQQERRISLVQRPNKKTKNKKYLPQQSLVSYDFSDSDFSEGSSSSSQMSASSDDYPVVHRRHRPKKHLDDSIEWEIAREERRWRRREKRRREIEREINRVLKHRNSKAKRSAMSMVGGERRRKSVRSIRTKTKSTASRRYPKKAKSAAIERISPDQLEENDEHGNATEPMKKPKNKRWTNEECTRLKLALQAIGPRGEDQWEKVAKSLGGGRTAVQCQQAANRVFGYDLQTDEGDMSQPVDLPTVTAKPGTATYRVQARKLMESVVLDQNATDDYFEQTGVLGDSIRAMPSLAEIDSDDSLLSALGTPKHIERGKVRGMHVEKPFSTPGSVFSPAAFRDSPMTPLQEGADRDRMERYVHQVNQDKKRDERIVLVERGKQAKNRRSSVANVVPAKYRRSKDGASQLLQRFLRDKARNEYREQVLEEEDEDEDDENDSYGEEQDVY